MREVAVRYRGIRLCLVADNWPRGSTSVYKKTSLDIAGRQRSADTATATVIHSWWRHLHLRVGGRLRIVMGDRKYPQFIVKS